MLVHGCSTHFLQLNQAAVADSRSVREPAEHVTALFHQAYHCRAQKNVPRSSVAHQISQPTKVARIKIPGCKAAARRGQVE